MFTAELLEGWLRESAINSGDVELAKPWLPSIAKLLNAYGEELSVRRDESDVKVILLKLGFALRTGVASPAELKEKVVAWLKEQFVEPPATVDAFLLDAPNNAPSVSDLKPPTAVHQAATSPEREPAEITRLRSETTKANGRKLAEAAVALRHRIGWLERGQEAFLGISTETHPKSGRGVNQFAQWLQGLELDGLPEVRMNCWESVFYTAYKANLISRGVVRGLFTEASHQAQVAIGEDSRLGLARNNPPAEIQTKSKSAYKVYLTTIFRHLKGPEAIPIKQDEVPEMGDLLFVDGMSHVCICVGMRPAPQGNDPVPFLMSLWHHDNERYTLLPFTVLLGECRGTISIRPCPF